MIKQAIATLIKRKNLSFEETRDVFTEIFEGKATPSQIAAFLVALRAKGEVYQEISAAASVIREKALKLKVRGNLLGIEGEEPVLDTCGTGGSGVNKFNISSAVAFVVAAGGVKVAKHGNRAMSSGCGSADVLETMGIRINAASKSMEEAIKTIGIGFLYAPKYHPAFKAVSPTRKEIGIKTIFNILGPLCNPALANTHLLGVFNPDLIMTLARSLRMLGSKRAFVVYGRDLKDEISLTGPTLVASLDNKRIKQFKLTPGDFGLKKCRPKDLEAKDAQESAAIIWDVFNGKKGPHQNITAMNASACFYLLRKVKNFKDGVALSRTLIETGKVKDKFLQLKRFLEDKDEL